MHVTHMGATPARSLDPGLLAEWRSLHRRQEPAASPFLHPAFVAAAASVRSGVEVAVARSGEQATAFLPFRRSRLGVGDAVAARLSDVSGPLADAESRWDPVALVRACGLRAIRLPLVGTTLPSLSPFRGRTVSAPFVDFARGFEAFRQESRDSGSSFIKQHDRRVRKTERDLGPIRFEWNTSDDSIFRTLLEWKGAQRRATGTPNVLDLPWARRLLERLRDVDDEDFGGVLSSLHIGDRLAAVHFGIRTDRTLHYWIPAYDPDFSKHSPGHTALVSLIEAAAARGMERLDLGAGEEQYKHRVSTGETTLGRITVCAHTPARAVLDAIDAARRWSRESPLGSRARAAARGVARLAYRVRGLGDRGVPRVSS